MVGYFQDNISNVVLKVEGDFDVKEMRKHPEYKEVTEKEYKEYQRKQKELVEG